MMSIPVVIVTGAAKRLGLSIVEHFAAKGFRIGLHFHQSVEEAQRIAENFVKKGISIDLFQADLSVQQDILRFSQELKTTYSKVDLLINNASIFPKCSFLETGMDDYEKNFSIHVKAPFFLSQAIASFSEAGHILNILDTRVSRVAIEHFAYSLSKHALLELTRMMAKALAPNFRVNAIAPGRILPLPEGVDDNDIEARLKKLPLKTPGSPADVIQAIDYLHDSSFITGECITVDGGENLI